MGMKEFAQVECAVGDRAYGKSGSLWSGKLSVRSGKNTKPLIALCLLLRVRAREKGGWWR